MTYKVCDMFGGIGGFRIGLKKSNLDTKVVEYIEKDEYAVKSYNAIFKEKHDPRDATQIKPETLEDFDILTAGFPCQSFSTAGNRGGFEDTRGTLFFEIARIAEEKLPKILLLENVKGLLSHADGETFRTIIQTLDELGYDLQWQVLNSKYHGVPQNRERVFIIGNRRGESRPEVFPFGQKTERSKEEHQKQSLNPIDDYNGNYTECFGSVRPTCSSKAPRNAVKIEHDGEVRALTPKECWRLQGFPDSAFEKAEEINGDTQLYKQAGNAVTTNVVEGIGDGLAEELN